MKNFNATSYLIKEYGEEMADEILNSIEEDLGLNGLDLFNSFENEEDVEDFIYDYLD